MRNWTDGFAGGTLVGGADGGADADDVAVRLLLCVACKTVTNDECTCITKRHARSSTLLCLPRTSIGGGQRRERREIRVTSTYHLEGSKVNVVRVTRARTVGWEGVRGGCVAAAGLSTAASHRGILFMRTRGCA